MIIRSLQAGCCGLQELGGISYGAGVDRQGHDWAQDFATIVPNILFRGQVIFTQAYPASHAKGTGYGWNLCRWLRKNRLGSVTVGRAPLVNPSHGPNHITIFIWSPNVERLKKVVNVYRKRNPMTWSAGTGARSNVY